MLCGFEVLRILHETGLPDCLSTPIETLLRLRRLPRITSNVPQKTLFDLRVNVGRDWIRRVFHEESGSCSRTSSSTLAGKA
jgi:hypothetical protein